MIKKLFEIFILAAICCSCTKDFIVPDISDKKINILAPADGLTTPNNLITFWWDKIENVDYYNIQIVKPSFNNVLQLITDTNVYSDKFVFTLLPGTYQWRIKGINSASQTQFSVRNLIIDTTSNLAFLNLALNNPSDSTFSNLLVHTFSWTNLNSATQYNFQLFNSSGGLIYSQNIINTSITYTFTSDGVYTWKVRGENSFSLTAYSSRTLIVDQIAPILPTLITPLNNTNVIMNDSLKWASTVDAYVDSIYISSDTNFNTNSSLLIKYGTQFNHYSIDASSGFLQGNQYYWKVKSIDRANNSSPFTNRRLFNLN